MSDLSDEEKKKVLQKFWDTVEELMANQKRQVTYTNFVELEVPTYYAPRWLIDKHQRDNK